MSATSTGGSARGQASVGQGTSAGWDGNGTRSRAFISSRRRSSVRPAMSADDSHRRGGAPQRTSVPLVRTSARRASTQGERGLRIHLDLWCDDLDAAVRRVGELGGRAPRGYESIPGRGTIAVVADPEGHEFCLISAEGSTPDSSPNGGAPND